MLGDKGVYETLRANNLKTNDPVENSVWTWMRRYFCINM